MCNLSARLDMDSTSWIDWCELPRPQCLRGVRVRAGGGVGEAKNPCSLPCPVTVAVQSRYSVPLVLASLHGNGIVSISMHTGLTANLHAGMEQQRSQQQPVARTESSRRYDATVAQVCGHYTKKLLAS